MVKEAEKFKTEDEQVKQKLDLLIILKHYYIKLNRRWIIKKYDKL